MIKCLYRRSISCCVCTGSILILIIQDQSHQLIMNKSKTDLSGKRKIWPGFHPFPFSLYNGTDAVLDGRLMDCPVSFSQEAPAAWSRILSEQAARREELAQAFLQEAHTTVTGSFRICGYDPMNLWRKGDTLYSIPVPCRQKRKYRHPARKGAAVDAPRLT